MCPYRSPAPELASPAGFDTAEAYHRSILATVPDAMIVIDDTGTILSFSAAAEAMFGYEENEVTGRNINILMPDPDRAAHDGYMTRYMKTGVARIIGIGRVTTAQRRDGSSFPIELSIGDAHTARGRVFTGFIRDLTERQRTERRLQDLQAELSHISRISAMDSLAAALAHELSQPLTAIANYMEGALDLVDRTDPDARALVREAMAEAAAQSLRAGQIVKRLRDFIARGSNERAIESLSRLVSEASALALTGIGKGNVDVEVRLDPAGDAVLVDRIQIQQVLLNLIRNAVEAMQRSPRRRLAIRARAVSGAMVEVSVSDSGPGIDTQMLTHLFEPFQSNKEQGMGLGLSISRTIIEAHGGRLWTDVSDLGGAAFHFTVQAAGNAETGHG